MSVRSDGKARPLGSLSIESDQRWGVDTPRGTVERTLDILRWVAEHCEGTCGVREIATELHMPVSTVHRALTSLEKAGMVQRDPETRRYRLDLELYRLASYVSARFPLANVAVPILRSFVDECNETTLLGVYDETRLEMMFVAAVESRHPLRYVVELNKWGPLYAGASGLAIMAFLPEADRRAIVARTHLKPVTERTIVDPVALEREMEKVRQRGYALTVGQRTPGAVGIAAPIWGADARVAGDILVTIPEQRFDSAMEPCLAELVIRCAKTISEYLTNAHGRSTPLSSLP